MEQVFDVLMDLQSQIHPERPIEEHLGIKCQVFTRSDFDDWKDTEAVCHRCHFNEMVPWRCDEISCASSERPDNQSVFFVEVK